MMSSNENKAEEGAAVQTVSLGDREMGTYIKIPSPIELNSGSGNTGGGTTGSGSDDPVDFLDGLFDRMSNSDNSNNGDEKLTAPTDASLLASFGGPPSRNIRIKTEMNDGDDDGGATNTATGASSNNSTMNESSPQLPQHLLYTASPNNQFLPTNLLHHNHAPPQQTQQQSQLQTSQPMQQPPQYGQTHSNVMSTASPQQSGGGGAPNSVSWLVQQSVASSPLTQALHVPSLNNQQNMTTTNLSTSVPSNHSLETIRSSMTIDPLPNPTTPPPPSSQLTLSPTKSTKSTRKRKGSLHNTTTESKEQPEAVSEDEHETHKRRKDRNMREQERSQRIANQIANLKNLLAMSNVPFKPDKYSTLVSVSEYIRDLQKRCQALDEEHKNLVTTISETNRVVNQASIGVEQKDQHVDGQSENVVPTTNDRSLDQDEFYKYIQGIDYESIFSGLAVPLCVAAIDGRLLDCNDEFAIICGLGQKRLQEAGLRSANKGTNENDGEAAPAAGALMQPLSLFNLVVRGDMRKVFDGMSAMLKSKVAISDNGVSVEVDSKGKSDFWSDVVQPSNHNPTVTNSQMKLNISLARNEGGTPTFFNCALTPLDSSA